MHQSVMDWVGGVAAGLVLDPAAVILEVGSFDVNGSVRPIFAGYRYLGVDVRPGRGVDRVVHWSDDYRRLGPFDVVVCTEVLEHANHPWQLVDHMGAALAPGGHLILTCRGFDERGCFPVHDHPVDLWRFSLRALVGIVAAAGLDVFDARPDPAAPGWFVLARRPPTV